MKLLILLDVVFFLIIVKYFRDIHASTKKIKENREKIVETLQNKEKYPNL